MERNKSGTKPLIQLALSAIITALYILIVGTLAWITSIVFFDYGGSVVALVLDALTIGLPVAAGFRFAKSGERWLLSVTLIGLISMGSIAIVAIATRYH